MAGGDDVAIVNDYRANWNVAMLGSTASVFEGDLHGLLVADGHGGGGGIRTHGGLHLTRFPSVPIRPLSHPSKSVAIAHEFGFEDIGVPRRN